MAEPQLPPTPPVHAPWPARLPGALSAAVARLCGIRKLITFRTVVAAIGLAAGLATVTWFSKEVVRCRWRTIQEVDTQGYIEMGKSFARLQWPRWPDEFSRFRGHVWIDPTAPPEDAAAARGGAPAPAAPALAKRGPHPSPVMAKYLPGWPLMLAVGYILGGAHGALWVNPLVAILGALAFFLLGRELFGTVAAAICTFIWVTSPMALMYLAYPLGHGPEVTCTLLALLCTVRWARTRRLRWALPAGFCAGFLPLLRPTTVLFWPAVALLYFAARNRPSDSAPGDASAARRIPDRLRHAWRQCLGGLRLLVSPRSWRAGLTAPGLRPWLAVALGAAVPLAFLAFYNWRSFGSPLRTGYAFTGEQRAFDLNWLSDGLNAHFGSTWSGGQGPRWIAWRWNALFRERFFVLEDRYWLLALLGLLLRPRRPMLAATFGLMLVPTLLLYMGYYFVQMGPVFYRFILPCVPVLILSIGFLFDGWLRRWPVLQLTALILFGLWAWQDPPRYFERRAEVAREDHLDSKKFPWGSPQARDPLTGGLAQATRPSRTADLEPWLTNAAIYAPEQRKWEVATYPSTTGYSLEAWGDGSYFGPFGKRQAGQRFGPVWGDMNRARAINAELTKIGREQLPGLFHSQVQHHLTVGRRVFVLVPTGEHHVLHWARQNPDWNVARVYERDSPPEAVRQGLEKLQLWEIQQASTSTP